jgi:hypothetical protein
MGNSFRDRVSDEENPTERHKKAHQRSDTDNSPSAMHHTIGEGSNQAASGKLVKKLIARVNDLEARIEALEP